MRKKERSEVGCLFWPKIKTRQKLPIAFVGLIRLAEMACETPIKAGVDGVARSIACPALPSKPGHPARPDQAGDGRAKSGQQKGRGICPGLV